MIKVGFFIEEKACKTKIVFKHSSVSSIITIAKESYKLKDKQSEVFVQGKEWNKNIFKALFIVKKISTVMEKKNKTKYQFKVLINFKVKHFLKGQLLKTYKHK